jgi:hypothetical protein
MQTDSNNNRDIMRCSGSKRETERIELARWENLESKWCVKKVGQGRKYIFLICDPIFLN